MEQLRWPDRIVRTPSGTILIEWQLPGEYMELEVYSELIEGMKQLEPHEGAKTEHRDWEVPRWEEDDEP